MKLQNYIEFTKKSIEFLTDILDEKLGADNTIMLLKIFYAGRNKMRKYAENSNNTMYKTEDVLHYIVISSIDNYNEIDDIVYNEYKMTIYEILDSIYSLDILYNAFLIDIEEYFEDAESEEEYNNIINNVRIYSNTDKIIINNDMYNSKSSVVINKETCNSWLEWNKVIVFDKLTEIPNDFQLANEKTFELSKENVRKFIFENLFLNNKYYEFEE